MKPSIIILHGWGLRGGVYKELIELLENSGFTVFSLDLPGFGSEKLRKQTMNLVDYANFVKKFMDRKKLKKVVLIGHSFGGRVAIKFATQFPENVQALILTGAPGIKQKLSFIRGLIQLTVISIGELFRIKAFSPMQHVLRKVLYFMIGEWDYYRAGDLRETFKKVISEDLSSHLSKIHISTLLIWGKEDKVVPLSIGIKMREDIPQSKLIIIKNIGHKLPYEDANAFFKACLPFLRQLV